MRTLYREDAEQLLIECGYEPVPDNLPEKVKFSDIAECGNIDVLADAWTDLTVAWISSEQPGLNDRSLLIIHSQEV